MNGLYIWGEVIVIIISCTIFTKEIPLFKKLLFPPMNKAKRKLILKAVVPMLIPVLGVAIVLDLLQSSLAFIFSSAMFILWILLLLPLYLSVLRKSSYGVLKLLILGICWAIFFILLALSIKPVF